MIDGDKIIDSVDKEIKNHPLFVVYLGMLSDGKKYERFVRGWLYVLS